MPVEPGYLAALFYFQVLSALAVPALLSFRALSVLPRPKPEHRHIYEAPISPPNPVKGAFEHGERCMSVLRRCVPKNRSFGTPSPP
jgi:hypothetical protein